MAEVVAAPGLRAEAAAWGHRCKYHGEPKAKRVSWSKKCTCVQVQVRVLSAKGGVTEIEVQYADLAMSA